MQSLKPRIQPITIKSAEIVRCHSCSHRLGDFVKVEGAIKCSKCGKMNILKR